MRGAVRHGETRRRLPCARSYRVELCASMFAQTLITLEAATGCMTECSRNSRIPVDAKSFVGMAWQPPGFRSLFKADVAPTPISERKCLSI
jgi:hypothetical protein